MLNLLSFKDKITVFQERRLPQPGILAGYAAIIRLYKLQVPLPYRLCLIHDKHTVIETGDWLCLTPRHEPTHSTIGHLIFALKYEGVDLLVLKRLFEAKGGLGLTDYVKEHPTSKYARKLWFLYEWLMGVKLKLQPLTRGNYVDLLDDKQYGVKGVRVKRQRIINNLPGTQEFCPLIKRTAKLEGFKKEDLPAMAQKVAGEIARDLLVRAASFMLLEDSKASYAIEGERPPRNRIERWGQVLGQAGRMPLDEDEFIRLQNIVIGETRFIHLGWRKEGGFIGTHDRDTGAPVPAHISARSEDLPSLIKGLIAYANEASMHGMDAVLVATAAAFGFVFIHPFEDGNGRLHRYLMHHILAANRYTPKGIVFPISSVILERINDYREVLENYSAPLLPFIDWEATSQNNVSVTNETIDFYRYFDATKQAEFLYECVATTIKTSLPAEVDYLRKFESVKEKIRDIVEMPDQKIELLMKFLRQNDGKLSARASSGEFDLLTEDEIRRIENSYKEVFE